LGNNNFSLFILIYGIVVVFCQYKYNNKDFTRLIWHDVYRYSLFVGIPIRLCTGDIQLFAAIGHNTIDLNNDTGAYLVGSAIGRRPLFPAVSPKKTIEGTLGGILLTIAAAYPLSLLNNAFTLPQWSIIAAITGITATMGDLVESKIKRQYNIKDTGNYLPGHGGFLIGLIPSYMLSSLFTFTYK
jgi:CDP-diglyceride synthetase